eukprot:scaffold91_cov143-Skeletonema_menzelii.AAC.28
MLWVGGRGARRQGGRGDDTGDAKKGEKPVKENEEEKEKEILTMTMPRLPLRKFFKKSTSADTHHVAGNDGSY